MEESLYQRTLEVWGEQAQYDQAVEECAELIAALMHYRRDKVCEEQVVDELADVILMAGQLRWMFGAERVDDAVRKKRRKLDVLLHDATDTIAQGSN